MLLQQLKMMAAYNVWANSTQCAFLEQATDEHLARHVTSSFPSIRDTLLHIWDAESVWLERLRGRSLDSFPSMRYDGTNRAILNALPGHSQRLLAYAESLSETDLMETLRYTTFNGTPFENTRAEMLQHCFNHSTYHRGQIVVFSRQMDLGTPPSTDLIYFLRRDRNRIS
ncbi:MAG: DinB family protein [Saprospiraceae bacterium]|nr:DinB family protein [Saprospiraceae bacterium]